MPDSSDSLLVELDRGRLRFPYHFTQTAYEALRAKLANGEPMTEREHRAVLSALGGVIELAREHIQDEVRGRHCDRNARLADLVPYKIRRVRKNQRGYDPVRELVIAALCWYLRDELGFKEYAAALDVAAAFRLRRRAVELFTGLHGETVRGRPLWLFRSKYRSTRDALLAKWGLGSIVAGKFQCRQPMRAINDTMLARLGGWSDERVMEQAVKFESSPPRLVDCEVVDRHRASASAEL